MESPRQPDRATDQKLVRDFLDDPGSAANPLLDRLRIVPRILAALNVRRGRRLDDHELADLTQDVFLLVLRKLGGFFGHGSLDGWLYRICEFELFNRLRKRRRGPVLLDDLPHADEPTADGPVEGDGRVDRALERLGGYESQIIRMHLADELDFAVIAQRLGISVANTRTRYYRGLTRLQEMLAPGAPDGSEGGGGEP